MRYADILNAHKSAAYAAYKGSITAPGMTDDFASVLANSWSQLVASLKSSFPSGASWYNPFSWVGTEGDNLPDNWSEVDAQLSQFISRCSSAALNVDSAGYVIYTADVWQDGAWLARLMDASNGATPAYQTANDVVADTLGEWGDKAKALASDSLEWLYMLLKWGAVAAVAIGGLALYVSLKD